MHQYAIRGSDLVAQCRLVFRAIVYLWIDEIRNDLDFTAGAAEGTHRFALKEPRDGGEAIGLLDGEFRDCVE